MTCIVGLTENGNVWIGGDSAGAAGQKSGAARRMCEEVLK